MAFHFILFYTPILLVSIFSVFMLLFYEFRLPSYRRKVHKLPGPKMSKIFGLGLDVLKVEHEGRLYCRNYKTTGFVFIQCYSLFSFSMIKIH